MQYSIAPEIFKAYDIRGIVGKTLNKDAIRLIASAYATQAHQQKVNQLAVGCDGRLSGSEIKSDLIDTLLQFGLDVIDIGQVTTPMLYFAALSRANGSGIMITGSHNPPQYNGFKLMLAKHTLAGEDIGALYRLITQRQLIRPEKRGRYSVYDITKDYIQTIVNDIDLKRTLKIVVDAGNGIAGRYIGELYRTLGCEVVELFCDVDGHFPNHHPDPAKPENLTDLIKAVQKHQADVGLAFDGDADRLGVVTKSGEVIYPDRLLTLFTSEILKKHSGAVICYDVKCTRLLEPWIRQQGGQPLLSRTGHSHIKAAMKKNKALLAGEMSGHIFFADCWPGFDDGVYAGARLLSILSRTEDASKTLELLPKACTTPELTIALSYEGDGHALIKRLQQVAKFDHAQQVVTIDGLRVEYTDGFALIRASNTVPALVLRFEGDNYASLQQVQKDFIQTMDPLLAEPLLTQLRMLIESCNKKLKNA